MSASSAREALLLGTGAMPPSPKSPVMHQANGKLTPSGAAVADRRQEIINDDAIFIQESRRPMRRTAAVANQGAVQHHAAGLPFDSEDRLQAALGLPSSVLLAQGLRRLLNSDEPLYGDLEHEQKAHLKREFQLDVGIVDSDQSRNKGLEYQWPLSPPQSPSTKRSRQVRFIDDQRERHCHCCLEHTQTRQNAQLERV